MQEQLNKKLNEIEKHQFTTPKDQLGYAEEYITINFGKPDDSILLNYSLSNSLEDIKIAVFKRTGLEIKLEKAKWYINPDLSINVKHLMNKHHVFYSMTTYYNENVRIISINMRVGDNWFYTSYGEIKGKCYSWDHFETLEKVKRMLKEIEDGFRYEEDD
jgi:hypothetical protein